MINNFYDILYVYFDGYALVYKINLFKIDLY